MTLFHKSVWSDHSKGKGIPSTTSGLWYVSTSGIWSCRTKLPADVQLGLILSLTFSQFMSGKPLLTFEHCSNQNLNNCLSRPRSCYALNIHVVSELMIVFYVHFMQWIRLVPTMYPAGVFVLILTDIFVNFQMKELPKGHLRALHQCVLFRISIKLFLYGERKQTRNLNKYSSCINCWSILDINTFGEKSKLN